MFLAKDLYQKLHGNQAPWLTQAECIKFAEDYHKLKTIEKRISEDERKKQRNEPAAHHVAY